MLFTSIHFAIFLPVIFILYWFVFYKNLRTQNCLLLVASYYFYGCWDWRFLFLLLFSTLLDYYTGIKIQESQNSHSRKFWLWLSIGINLGFLGIFKYYNFFIESFTAALTHFGVQVNPHFLTLVLPVGISFYTFHGLSYVIDIYKGRIQSERNFIEYAVFVSFFPLLVAGPIERATHLLPQIKKERHFDYSKAVDGLRQILWGFFKKVVIADNCAFYVNEFFNTPDAYSGSTLLLGALLFSFQIYGDFSGYTDIALGTARLFGIELLQNFAFPYFSRDIAEFWRRWHISLSSWFRDYVYIPLGGSKSSFWIKIRNIFIIFILSGFWHGANGTFIVWGILNAFYFLPLFITGKNRNHLEIVGLQTKVTLRDILNIFVTFGLTTLAWVFFRAESIPAAITYLSGIFSPSLFSNLNNYHSKDLIILILFFMTIEWFGRKDQYAIQTMGLQWKRQYRYAFYSVLILLVIWYSGNDQTFIYFQF
ncbi:MBOAT family O-acyltransferase [Flavobacterium sp.]|uniref:MBOAT family O-acyltransferase n=1 Tax=Flavobacterium sp. TaxID=239 RepID=UPI0026374130|nr:MBOAT family O-acyltransferase [Flavobacterium sp.]